MSTKQKHLGFESGWGWRKGLALLLGWMLLMIQAHATSMSGGSPPATKSSKVVADKQLKRDYSVTAIPLQIELDQVTATEKEALATQDKDQPLKIGFGRELPASEQGDLYPQLSWESLGDDHSVATFSVTSPDAKAIRMALKTEGLPEDAELRFFGTQNSESFGPFTAESMQVGDATKTSVTEAWFWSPVIEGDTIGVEIYFPTATTHEFSIQVPEIQHLVYSPQNPDSKSLSELGQSGSCNIDIKCVTTVPSDLSAAVAKIIFSDKDGAYLCTGTLLNDSDSSTWIPYFITANHCLSTQAVADTIDTYWFFERAECGGADPTSVTHFTGGGNLLATSTNSDFTFLQLRDSEISSLSGIHFAGWSTADPTGLSAIGIHHPHGDVKKWSQGTAVGYAPYGESVNGSGSHIFVEWSQGVTEGGSSGSGLFVATGEQNGQQLYVGNLHGGSSSCMDPSAPDWYGRFDLTYPSISQWLESSGSGATLESPRSGSYESGIGLIRGWVCQANKVEIQIDGGTRQQVAYGTTRDDTEAACGDTNNGFGYTFNWNRLASGSHNLRAYADDVKFADVDFTVTTVGVEYLTGAEGQYELPSFPQTGSSAIISWSEPHQNFVIVGVDKSATTDQTTVTPVVSKAGSGAVLESPQSGSYESGIGLIRGWVCQADKVEIQLDGGDQLQVAYGTTREDTASVCGDTNNGFGYTFNWNRLGNGSHNLRAFADGVEFANVNFTVTTLGVEYLEGVSKSYRLLEFPQSSDNVVVSWSEPDQNFVITSFTQ